jgi:hypothetical protein
VDDDVGREIGEPFEGGRIFQIPFHVETLPHRPDRRARRGEELVLLAEQGPEVRPEEASRSSQ